MLVAPILFMVFAAYTLVELAVLFGQVVFAIAVTLLGLRL